ncbi:MAG TPA: LuxR C-terminal-related transcriptional regulator [Gammaproteobacteria bacterium]|nr:LuxR C-terminal-related transcriptional regulator [Gammaproteobacteria bacterium]
MANGVHDLRSFSARQARGDESLAASGRVGLSAVVDQIRHVARALRDPVTGPHRCEALAADLLRLCDRLASMSGAGGEPVPTEVRRAYATLSPRELEIFAALAQGLSVGDIATRLSRSPKTVNNHRTHIMKKLGLRNTAELTRLAFRLGVASL